MRKKLKEGNCEVLQENRLLGRSPLMLKQMKFCVNKELGIKVCVLLNANSVGTETFILLSLEDNELRFYKIFCN